MKWDLRGSVDFVDTAGRVSRDLTEWDGIVGVKGQLHFGDKDADLRMTGPALGVSFRW